MSRYLKKPSVPIVKLNASAPVGMNAECGEVNPGGAKLRLSALVSKMEMLKGRRSRENLRVWIDPHVLPPCWALVVAGKGDPTRGTNGCGFPDCTEDFSLSYGPG